MWWLKWTNKKSRLFTTNRGCAMLIYEGAWEFRRQGRCCLNITPWLVAVPTEVDQVQLWSGPGPGLDDPSVTAKHFFFLIRPWKPHGVSHTLETLQTHSSGSSSAEKELKPLREGHPCWALKSIRSMWGWPFHLWAQDWGGPMISLSSPLHFCLLFLAKPVWSTGRSSRFKDHAFVLDHTCLFIFHFSLIFLAGMFYSTRTSIRDVELY